MMFSILISLAIISAILHIFFDYKKKHTFTYLFKPLTIILIIIAATIKPTYYSNGYQYYIIAGLCFSLIGDIFLMLKKSDFFTYGLLAFLFAHFAYILAITVEFGILVNLYLLIPILLYFIILLKQILPNASDKKVYLIIYSSIIGLLLWLTLSLATFSLTPHIIYFVLGVLCFTISDSLLAYNKFVKNLNFAQLLILSTYYIAQILIVMSI